MNKKEAASVKVGTVLIFAGYTDKPEEETFTKGDRVVVYNVVDKTTFDCHLEGDKDKVEQLFAEEIASIASEDTPATKKATTPPAKKAPAKKAVKKTAAKKTGKKQVEKAEQVGKAEKPEEIVLAKSDYKGEIAKHIQTDNSALKAAKTYSDRIKQTFWEFGGILSFIRQNKSYLKMQDSKGDCPYAGNEGFALYCETELDIKYRRAMDYIGIFEQFTIAGISDPETIIAVGYAKARELVKVIDKKNHKSWLKKAESMTRDDLAATIKKIKVDGSSAKGANPDTTATMTRLRFAVFEDQGEIVQAALKKAGEAIDSDDPNAQLVHIMTEWQTLTD